MTKYLLHIVHKLFMINCLLPITQEEGRKEERKKGKKEDKREEEKTHKDFII